MVLRQRLARRQLRAYLLFGVNEARELGGLDFEAIGERGLHGAPPQGVPDPVVQLAAARDAVRVMETEQLQRPRRRRRRENRLAAASHRQGQPCQRVARGWRFGSPLRFLVAVEGREEAADTGEAVAGDPCRLGLWRWQPWLVVSWRNLVPLEPDNLTTLRAPVESQILKVCGRVDAVAELGQVEGRHRQRSPRPEVVAIVGLGPAGRLGDHKPETALELGVALLRQPRQLTDQLAPLAEATKAVQGRPRLELADGGIDGRLQVPPLLNGRAHRLLLEPRPRHAQPLLQDTALLGLLLVVQAGARGHVHELWQLQRPVHALPLGDGAQPRRLRP
mmetsp:Transcript_72001/g.223520  ORF Transcript_72001/g.223520 Transcript_72001/m.223520 type:complete len:334 (+) Transcript_72001:585-1586(+)